MNRVTLALALLWTGCTALATPPVAARLAPPPSTGGAAWPGDKFVVHEWGTDTIVVGSDGTMQRGLHHEEEDLPAFVYDRVKAGMLPGSTSVEVKMETPVLYFYSSTARQVDVSVQFPKGVMTQWYPAVRSFWPMVGRRDGTVADPVMDIRFPFQSTTCAQHYPVIANGVLDWGTVDVEAPGATDEAEFPSAPLDQFTWGHARQVAASGVVVQGVPGAATAQHERFLFYRGLGNFDLPVSVRYGLGDRLSLLNTSGHAMGATVVINVTATGGAFRVIVGGIAANAAAVADVPTDMQPLDAYASALGDAVTAALDGTGLYHDEAVAMVATWSRQWFRTPGVRVLYLAPQAWTETQLPLHLAPAPDELVRVMMIRVEVLSPALEAADLAQAQSIQTDPSTATAYFVGLGRFGEPRLRRALAQLGNPAYGDGLLAQIAGVNTSVAAH